MKLLREKPFTVFINFQYFMKVLPITNYFNVHLNNAKFFLGVSGEYRCKTFPYIMSELHKFSPSKL